MVISKEDELKQVNMKIETLKDLKDLLNSLNDEQLNQKAVLSIVDGQNQGIRSAYVRGLCVRWRLIAQILNNR